MSLQIHEIRDRILDVISVAYKTGSTPLDVFVTLVSLAVEAEVEYRVNYEKEMKKKRTPR